MDHPQQDDDAHALLDPSLDSHHAQDHLAVLSSFDQGQHDGPDQPSSANAGQSDDASSLMHYPHSSVDANGAFAGQDFGQPSQSHDGGVGVDGSDPQGQQHGDEIELEHDQQQQQHDGVNDPSHPSISDDGLGSSSSNLLGGGGGKRRRSGPPGGAELDLSTPEGQAKKKARVQRAAYMREYRKKKSQGKNGGSVKADDGMGMGSNSGQYTDNSMLLMSGEYDDKLKDIPLDPSIASSSNLSYSMAALQAHYTEDPVLIGPQGPFLPKYTQFTHPHHLEHLPVPKLRFLFHLECDMESFREIGDGPFGKRMNVMFKGGQFEGPSIRGTIIPGGGDWEIVDPESSDAFLDTRYVLQTHDGASIYIQTTGVRTGPKDVLDSLGDNTNIPASSYTMRLNVKLETGDERYKWLNKAVCVASAARCGSQVVYDTFQVC